MSMAACRDALDNTSAQDMWAAHCSEYLFISIVENNDDLLMFFFHRIQPTNVFSKYYLQIRQ